jgi:DNA-binding CsgD family transcriptional regulator/TPP-dependent trihydroxycyclohexane-1,2-dione (THcHDO) dehydratase
VCIGTLGPGVANMADAMMCAKVENSPVIFLGGQRARITEQRVRRGRIQFVKQAGLFEPSVKYCASIEYADQTDEVIREGLRKALSRTPGPVYIEYPANVITQELDVPPALPPTGYRLVNQTAGADKIAEAVTFIGAAKMPILLVGHGVHTARLIVEATKLFPADADQAGARTLMREVDDLLKRRPGLGTLAADAGALRAQLSRERGSSVPGASALTAAELRLLPLLSTHLSFPEIAAEMFLSRTMIKSQAISIYRRLGACSRGQAVARSRELGLLEG